MSETANLPTVKFTDIRDAISPIIDPEIKVSIVELGLIYGAEVKAGEPGKGDT